MVDIYLCDDVPELRQLLRIILEEDPGLRVVGETGDARSGSRRSRSSSRTSSCSTSRCPAWTASRRFR